MHIQNILEKLYQGKSINYYESYDLFSKIIQGQLSPEKISGVLISMKIRMETPEEISGAACALLKYAKQFPRPEYLFSDISGTGGDCKNTINISTVSAIVAASCGIKIAKHGNHKISSQTGSADLLSEFNLPLKISAEQSRNNLEKFGICFLYAPQYHPGLQYVKQIRKQLKVPTIFNILGPLVNPAKPPLALIGVYKKELIFPIVHSLSALNYQHAAVVHCDGTDEIGLHAPTHISEFHNGKIENYVVTPEDFGLKYQNQTESLSESSKNNFDSILNLLQGTGKPEHEFIIAANVAILLKLFGNNNLAQNTNKALQIIHQKKPYKYLMAFKKFQYYE